VETLTPLAELKQIKEGDPDDPDWEPTPGIDGRIRWREERVAPPKCFSCGSPEIERLKAASGSLWNLHPGCGGAFVYAEETRQYPRDEALPVPAEGPRQPTCEWPLVFGLAVARPGASQPQIEQLLDSIVQPLSEDEINRLENVLQRNPFPPGDPMREKYVLSNAARLVMPRRRLPESYVDFLGWSNGGRFRNGMREMAIFPCAGVREMMLLGLFPAVVPGVVPFAKHKSDYLGFDTAADPTSGEFPVVYVPHDNPDPVRMASGFREFCEGTSDPEEMYRQARRNNRLAP
jgi:hypothetical protein